MTRHASLLAAAAVLTFGATSSTVFAQGFGYNAGSAGGAAVSLGFTASPPIAQNSNVPAAAAAPAVEPVTTGSVARRERAWTRLHHR